MRTSAVLVVAVVAMLRPAATATEEYAAGTRVEGLLAGQSAASARAPAVPAWAACLAAVQARYPVDQTTAWCESAAACLPDAVLAQDESTWLQATAGALPAQRYERMRHVFVHLSAPSSRCRKCRLWLRRREPRVHVWLGDPDRGLDYLRRLWRVAGLVDVLLLLPAGDGAVLLYSVFPYGVPGERAGPCDSDAPVLVDEWVPDDGGGPGGGAFRHGRDLFPRDKLRDLRGCNLTVYINEDHPFMEVETNASTGEVALDGKLKDVFRVTRQHLNFRAVFRSAANATSSCESRLATQLKHAQLGFTMAVRSASDGPVWYDESTLVVCLVWCVPITSVTTPSLGEYLSSGTWSVIGLSIVATGVAMALVHRPGADVLGGLWGAWALLCGPLLQQPVAFSRRGAGTQVRTLALRAVVAHWGLAAVVLVTVFEGSVKSASVASRSQPLLHTVDELARSSLTLQGSVGVVDLLRQTSQEQLLHGGADKEMVLYHHLAARLRVCDSHLNAAMHRVADDHDTAVLTVDIRCNDYNHRNPNARVFVFRDYCLRPSTLHLFTAPQWSPYLKRVSEVVVRLRESGLMTRAVEATHVPPGLRTLGRSSTSTVSWAALRVEAVAPPLCILYAGLLLALAALGAELAWARSSRSHSHSTLARKYSVHKDEV